MAVQIFDLSGKVSVVSGAAQGMGRAMSVALAESGSDMAIIDLNESGLSDTASHIRPRLSQSNGHCSTHSLSSSRNYRYFSGQIKNLNSHYSFLDSS
jgi:NAD(P)-dependent dehydrogenase (short-subunit alcohol dehydrogenase family)